MIFPTSGQETANRSRGFTRRGVVLAGVAVLSGRLLTPELASQERDGARKIGRITGWAGSNQIAIRVLSVTADAAGQRRIGDGRIAVPVRIGWETDPWGDRVLLELKATLDITDDSGATVELTRDVGVKDREDTLIVTLDEGRMPKYYRLVLVGQCRFTDEDGKERVEPTIAELAGTF
jgi:hypothetical protein